MPAYSPRSKKKTRRHSCSSSTSSSELRSDLALKAAPPARRPIATGQRALQAKHYSLSASLSRSRSSTLPSPTKRAFQVLAEPVSVAVRMRHDLPPRARKRKRSSAESDSDRDGMSSGMTASQIRRTRSAARIEECVNAVGNIHFDSDGEDDVEAAEENEFGDPDDEYYLHHAMPSQLARLRKDKLAQLWTSLIVDYPQSQHARDNQEVDPTDLSKAELVTALIEARDEAVSSPDEIDDSPRIGRSSSLPPLFSPQRSTSPPRKRMHHTRSASLTDNRTSAQHSHRGRILRSSSSDQIFDGTCARSSAHFAHELEDIDEDVSFRQPTPIARRTRASAPKVDSAHSQKSSIAYAVLTKTDAEDETIDDGSLDGSEAPITENEPTDPEICGSRVLRNGKVIPLDDTDDNEVQDVGLGDMSLDVGAPDDTDSDDEHVERIEEEDQEFSSIDWQSASIASLLRYRRNALVQLCDERNLESEGTKKDLAARLIDWHAITERDEEVDSEPDLDTSFRNPQDSIFDNSSSSVSPTTSDNDTETEDAKRPKVTRRNRQTRKNETKTQALAQIDRSSFTKSGSVPLLDSTHRTNKRPRPPGPVVAEETAEEEEDDEEGNIGLDLESLNLQDKAISADALVRGEKIGSGGFKDVYRGKYRHVKVAIADIRERLTDNEIKELGLLRDLRHENIVKLIGVVVYDPATSSVPCSLVTELCLNGDLFDYVRRDAPAPSFDKVLKIMTDVAQGLQYLHKRTPKIIHRDMKSSNVLITAKGVAKLTDFGLARVKHSTRSLIRSLVGTVNWQAPELWVPHPRYNEKVDCYAAGMVFWEMLQWHQHVKKYPFEGMNEHGIYHEVGQKQNRPSVSGLSRQWGSDIVDLIKQMWSQLPGDRPSMTEVVETLQALQADWKANRR